MHHITNHLSNAQCSLSCGLLHVIQVVQMQVHTARETCKMLLIIGSSPVKTQLLFIAKTKMLGPAQCCAKE